MQPEQTTTPFRQLYFIVQTMVIDPANASSTKELFDTSCLSLSGAVSRRDLHAALADIRESVEAKRYYEALKKLRSCFVIEDEILDGQTKVGELL